MKNSVDRFTSPPSPSSNPSRRLWLFRRLMRLMRSMQGRFDLSRPNSIVRFRRWSEWLADRFMHPPRAVKVQTLVIDRVRCERLIPPGSELDGSCLLFLHGGGMVFGYGGPHRRLLGRLALETGMSILAVDYSLAPEARYPTAHDECWTVYQHLLTAGRPFILIGESSGGAMALAMMLRAKEAGLPQPQHCALISPMVDLLVEERHLAAFDDPFLAPAFAVGLQKLYLGPEASSNPDISPVEADLAGLAPLLVMAAEQEALIGEVERLAAKAKSAGIECRILIWPHVWHGWHILVGELPEARRAMKAFADEILTHA